MCRYVRGLVVFATVLLAPAAAFAQASIVGTAKDASGAVLPGVTVEASSPALIEKTRSVVSSGTGQYAIEDLRPGTYSVTFTLPGFTTVVREGIELTGSFIATVNADMKIGGVTETITVTGETPIVDVTSALNQTTISGDTISREDRWPTDADLGSVVILPGGEAGILTAWWNAEDGSAWRWSVELSNRRE